MAAMEESAFLRRLRNNAEHSRPVPGQIRIARAVSDESPAAKTNQLGVSNANISASSADTTPRTKASPVVAAAVPAAGSPPGDQPGKYVSTYKYSQFEKLLSMDNVDVNALRKLAWNGIPAKFRADVWQILLGYLPSNKQRRSATLSRRRTEYTELLTTYFNAPQTDRTHQDEENHSQILLDLPRTSPNVAFFQQPLVVKAMERILYVWSVRHPASGYVQGMNDLLTPLMLVTIQPFVEDPLRCDVASLSSATLVCV